MKINKIIVENYRSITKAEIDPNKFSVFVGQNNHGKTNLFEAIEWFYTAKSTSDSEKPMQDSSEVVSVEIFFSDVEDSDIEKLTADAAKTKIRGLLDGNTDFSIKKTSATHKRTYVVDGEDKGNPSGLDTAINEFIPKLEYVSTKVRLDDVSKYSSKNAIGQMLSGVMAKIIETTPEYVAFQEQFSKLFNDDTSEVRVKLDELGDKVQLYLEKQFPDGSKVDFKVNPPQFTDLLKSFETTVDDGVATKAEDKGDGMQRAIMLSIIQAYADYRKQEAGGGSFLFLIDEAELHLHPSAQRALKLALLDIAATDQVMINTHSSVFVADDHALQNTFKVNKASKVTEIAEATDNDRADIIYDLLGGSPADLLLPKNFLIVEGRSEYFFIKKIVDRFYAGQFGAIKVIYASGDIDQQERGIIAVHEMLKPIIGDETPVYKDRVVVLLDKPNSSQQTKYDQFKQGYPYLFSNNQVFELTENSLEEYYPGGYKKNPEEVKALQAQTGGKAGYANQVAEAITQADFEGQMQIIYDALKKADELGFGD